MLINDNHMRTLKLIEKLTIGMASFTRTTVSCLIQPFNAAIVVSLQWCSLSLICHLQGAVLLCSSCETEELLSSATVPDNDTGTILSWQAPPTKILDATLVQWMLHETETSNRVCSQMHPVLTCGLQLEIFLMLRAQKALAIGSTICAPIDARAAHCVVVKWLFYTESRL